jgi:hypothetical protein
MKPNTPEQLARLLDQVSALYPNGIPREVIKFVASSDEAGPSSLGATPPRFHIFVVGLEETVSEGSRQLLSGITEKGLKLGPSEFLVSYLEDGEVEGAAVASEAPHVIVFGGSRTGGWVERIQGAPVLFASSLNALISDAGLKKALWRELQTLL